MANEINKFQRNLYNTAINSVQYNIDKNGNMIATTTIPISLDIITADPRYQRIETSSERKIWQLAKNWDDAMCDPVRLVAHPNECMFYLIDGWHRFNAAKMIGRETIEAKIIICKNDGDDRTKYEAGLFLRQGDHKEKLTPAQMHNGRILTNDKAALKVKELCKRDKVEINPAAKYGSGMLCNYTKAYKFAKSEGCLEFIFDVIKLSDFNLEVNGYSGYLMAVFYNLYKGYGKSIKAKFVADYLRPMTIDTFKSRAIAKYPEHSSNCGTIAMTMYLQDYIMENMDLPAIYDNNGKKIVSLVA